ncbi:hypothetical protein FJ656_02890 [Schumannella luteola]|uniref:Uncharacterized protein n=1 Tax=Schumannella luteola TaxID=472059 RepID=A0A852YJP2_9MICO|nr:hypothetical protein [Schumannella luteola]NYG99368.1 hypothetical protein [Schumannella luteola]TPX06095.1 hypothetical protein FJ656_02890 [Schumannella luteola]
MARSLSLLIAVVASLGGGALALSQGGVVYRTLVSSFGGLGNAQSVGVLAIALTLVAVGALLHLVASATAGWSSLGVIVVGAVQTVVGLAAVVLPARFGGIDGPASPVQVAVGWIYDVLPDLGTGLYLALPTGLVLVIGLANILLGVVAVRRRRGTVASPAVARIVGLLVALFVALPAAGLIAAGGFANYVQTTEALRGPSPWGIALLLLGAVLFLIFVLAVRWSSLAALLGGFVLIVASIFYLFVPASAVAPIAAQRGLRDALSGVQTFAWSGSFLILGCVLIGAGIAGRLAGRVGARRSSFVAARPSVDGDAPTAIILPGEGASRDGAVLYSPPNAPGSWDGGNGAPRGR